jgi:predicted MFS family arabinose efflux permease
MALAYATNVTGLYVSQIFSLGMHAMHCAQAALTYLTPDETERASRFGRLSLAYGIGMLSAPALGGYASSTFGFNGVAFIAGSVSFAITIITALFLPTDHHSGVGINQTASNSNSDSSSSKSKSNSNSNSNSGVWAMLNLLKIPSIAQVLAVKLVVGIALANYRTAFSLRNKQVLSPAQNGFVMSLVGGLSILANSFLVPFVKRRISNSRAIIGGAITLCITFVLYGYAGEEPRAIDLSWFPLVTPIVEKLSTVLPIAEVGQVQLGLLVPLCFGMSVISTILSTTLTVAAPSNLSGSVLGLDFASNSLARIVSPSIGAYLYQQHGYSHTAYASCIAAICATILVLVSGHQLFERSRAPVTVNTDSESDRESRKNR